MAEKTWTQSEVHALLDRTTKTKEERLVQLETKIEKLTQDRDRTRKDLAELQKANSDQTAKLQEYAVRDALVPALQKAGVKPEAQDDALFVMTRRGSPEFDKYGRLAIDVGDRRHSDPDAAALEFLQANPHFVGQQSSETQRRPNGRPSRADRDDMRPSELIAAGLAEHGKGWRHGR